MNWPGIGIGLLFAAFVVLGGWLGYMALRRGEGSEDS